MGDVSSGMASTVIQVYLKAVLEAFLHPSVAVRHAALKVIQLILAQGLVHPVQIVPYLVCMSTDAEQRVSHTADKELQVIQVVHEIIFTHRFTTVKSVCIDFDDWTSNKNFTIPL